MLRLSKYLTAIVCCLFPVLATETCYATHGLQKIRPEHAPPSPASGTVISAAQNEYESFQIVCASFGGNSFNVTSLVLEAPAGISSLIHGVRYYRSVNNSDCDALGGRMPDALIPAVDPFSNETRAVFPVVVGPTESRLLWVDVFVQRGAAQGRHTINITVELATFSSASTFVATSVELVVWPFVLPDTSPYATHFLVDELPQLSPPAKLAAALSYSDLSLMHRVTPANAFTWDPSYGSRSYNLTAFAATWGSFWRGRTTPFGLQNTTFTAVQLPVAFCANFTGGCTPSDEASQISSWAAVHAFFATEGVSPLLFDYTIDEPDYCSAGALACYAELQARSAAVHDAAPSLRVLCTTSMEAASAHNVTGVIDLWVPIINEVENRGQCMPGPPGNQRAAYTNVSTRNLWWYQSCCSHGCGGGCEVQDSTSCNVGWPSYMIDHSAVTNRIMAWQTYLYDMGGELYWSINFAASQGWDDLTTQWFAGGNGDGTLTVWGTPEEIGGTTSIPLATQRLKLVRDGQEDLLLMHLAESAAGRVAVLNALAGVVTNAYSFTGDATLLLQARDSLAQLIMQTEA